MEWTAALATGNTAIDAQHEALLGCLSDLKRALKENRTLFAVYTITRLKHHVFDHLAAEETLLRDHGHVDLAAHLDEHQQFRFRLIDFQSRAIHGDVPMETVDVLAAWLGEHVSTVARDYRSMTATAE